MKKSISRGVHKAAQRGQKMVDLDKKLSLENFDDVVYSENGKEIKRTIPYLHSARTYIGKMKKDGESIYSDDLLILYMTYFFKNSPKGEDIELVVAPILSEILNGKESMEGYFTAEDEKKHIIKIAKKYFPEKYKELKIIDIESMHQELFEVLRKEGSKGLASSVLPTIDMYKYNSLDIAKYLYWIAKNNNEFMKKIYNLKTAEQKNIDKQPMGENEGDWYGLCEIAMRLTDYLKGTNIQGGVRRQKEYDDIIVKILNEKIPVTYGSQFEELRSFCKKIKGRNSSFNAVHFDTKKSENIEEKYQEKQGILKKIRKIVNRNLLGVLLTSAVFVGFGEYKQDQKEQKIIDLKNEHEKKMKSEMSAVYIEGVEKVSTIADHISNDFYDRYGYGDLTANDVKAGIEDYILRDGVRERRLDTLSNNINDEFITYNFCQEFINVFFWNKMFENGFDSIQNQPFLKGLEKDFLGTLNYQGPLLREGYNETKKNYSMIHATMAMDNPEGIKGLENIDLVKGYMLERTGTIDTVKTRASYVRDNMNLNPDYIILSESKPDENDFVIVRRFFFNEDPKNVVKRLQSAPLLIFENTYEDTEIGEHKNLVMAKSLILECFEKNNPVFNKIRQTYKKTCGIEKHYMGKMYYPENFWEIEVLMLNDLYRNDVFGIPNVSKYSDEVVDQYLVVFQKKYEKKINEIIKETTPTKLEKHNPYKKYELAFEATKALNDNMVGTYTTPYNGLDLNYKDYKPSLDLDFFIYVTKDKKSYITKIKKDGDKEYVVAIPSPIRINGKAYIPKKGRPAKGTIEEMFEEINEFNQTLSTEYGKIIAEDYFSQQ